MNQILANQNFSSLARIQENDALQKSDFAQNAIWILVFHMYYFLIIFRNTQVLTFI